MKRYPYKAIILKTLDQFTYDIYSAMSVNMLKYNHDTSASIRLLSALVNTSREILEDLPFQISFNLKGLDFVNIDRLNAFYWPKIQGLVVDENGDTNCLIGYSRYTDRTYSLGIVPKQTDFIRHSLPIDMFFSGAVPMVQKQEVVLAPYIKESVNFEVENSQITIYPYQGFSYFNLESNEPAKVVIYGIDTNGNSKREEISILASINYTTNTEWKLITGFLLCNMAASGTIVFYPYIPGDICVSKNIIIQREAMEPGICIITMDYQRKSLVYNMLRENSAEYPLQYDIIKTVPLEIPANNAILSHYIDEPNKLLYVVHRQEDTNVITSCFPLIIPVTPNNTLDRDKTKYQAVSIEYEEDCINEEWNLWLYPTSKTNDVESCTIVINGKEYLQDIILDLYRYDIETNRITIPFADIYDNGIESALVEIYTSGAQQSYNAFTLDRTILKALYNVNLHTMISKFKDGPDTGLEWSSPIDSTTNKIYKAPSNLGGYGEGEYGGSVEDWFSASTGFGGRLDVNAYGIYELFRLSGTANVVINGQKIVNVFATFYFDESNNYVITSDTITHIRAGACSDYNPLFIIADPPGGEYELVVGG